MDIRLLEAFRAVADHRSVTSAAAALGVTQPAVSAQISRLESDLGFQLFDRSGGRMRPTQEGLLFYAEATKALSGLDRLAEAAERIRGAVSGRLVLASHPSAAISLLPPLVAEFLAARPGVEVRMLTRSSDVVSRLLPAESFDLAVAEPPIDEAAFRVVRHRLRCVVALPPAHRLARRKVVTPQDLSGLPFVATWRASLTYQRTKEAFAAAGAALNVVAETEFFASACTLAASGAGATIVDPLSASTFAGLGLVVRRFEPAIPYEICVFHGAELSVLARTFLDLLDGRLAAASEKGTSS